MVDWLSSNMVIVPTTFPDKSLMSCCSHITSCKAVDSATYSASAVDRATVVYLVLFQLTAGPPIEKHNQILTSCPWCHPSSLHQSSPPYHSKHRLCTKVPVVENHSNNTGSALQLSNDLLRDWHKNKQHECTANTMSNLILADGYNMLPTTAWYLC